MYQLVDCGGTDGVDDVDRQLECEDDEEEGRHPGRLWESGSRYLFILLCVGVYVGIIRYDFDVEAGRVVSLSPLTSNDEVGPTILHLNTTCDFLFFHLDVVKQRFHHRKWIWLSLITQN